MQSSKNEKQNDEFFQHQKEKAVVEQLIYTSCARLINLVFVLF